MEITVNGQSRILGAATSVAELLSAMGFAGKPVLVEHNTTALLAREHAITHLQAGDRIEIIQIVAGG